MPASGKSDVAVRRQAWFAMLPDRDLERAVFVEGTGASNNSARLRGRAERCLTPVRIAIGRSPVTPTPRDCTA